MVRLTVGQVAELLEKVEGYVPADYFARQLRVYAQRGLLGPLEYRGHGRTAAALLGEREICLARLLSVMSRSNLQHDQLYDATRCLTNMRLLDYEGPRPSPSGLPGVIEKIKAGEQWFFVLKIGPWSRVEDPAVGEARGGFYNKYDPSEPDLPTLMTIVIDCTALFGPVLQRLGEIPSGPEHDDPAEA